jgi:hypothetical protein
VGDNDGIIHHSNIIVAIAVHKQTLGMNGGYKYQIKLEGYNMNKMTWKPAANLSNAKQMLEEYKKQYGLGYTKVK